MKHDSARARAVVAAPFAVCGGRHEFDRQNENKTVESLP